MIKSAFEVEDRVLPTIPQFLAVTKGDTKVNEKIAYSTQKEWR